MARWYKRNNPSNFAEKNKPEEILKLAVKRMLPKDHYQKSNLQS